MNNKTIVGKFTTATLRLVTVAVVLPNGDVRASFSSDIPDSAIVLRQQHPNHAPLTLAPVTTPSSNDERPNTVRVRVPNIPGAAASNLEFTGKVLGETTTHWLLRNTSDDDTIVPEWWAKRFCVAVR